MGRDSFFATNACPALGPHQKKRAMSPSSAVHGGQCDTKKKCSIRVYYAAASIGGGETPLILYTYLNQLVELLGTVVYYGEVRNPKKKCHEPQQSHMSILNLSNSNRRSSIEIRDIGSTHTRRFSIFSIQIEGRG